MTEETIGCWMSCVVDSDYEIWSEYPYPIRKKGSERIIKEYIPKKFGYVMCHLNSKTYRKHRIIAQQFIPNDDPENKPFIDHINHNRTDNRIENLRWVSYSENNKNKSKRCGVVYEYFDDIPCESEDGIIDVRDYDERQFENLYYCDDWFYLWNGIQYRRLHINHDKKSGLAYVNVNDTEGKKCGICYSKFKRLYGID